MPPLPLSMRPALATAEATTSASCTCAASPDKWGATGVPARHSAGHGSACLWLPESGPWSLLRHLAVMVRRPSFSCVCVLHTASDRLPRPHMLTHLADGSQVGASTLRLLLRLRSVRSHNGTTFRAPSCLGHPHSTGWMSSEGAHASSSSVHLGKKPCVLYIAVRFRKVISPRLC